MQRSARYFIYCPEASRFGQHIYSRASMQSDSTLERAAMSNGSSDGEEKGLETDVEKPLSSIQPQPNHSTSAEYGEQPALSSAHEDIGHSDQSVTEDENLEVYWDEPADQDPMNPMNWSSSRKNSTIVMVSFMTFLTLVSPPNQVIFLRSTQASRVFNVRPWCPGSHEGVQYDL